MLAENSYKKQSFPNKNKKINILMIDNLLQKLRLLLIYDDLVVNLFKNVR